MIELFTADTPNGWKISIMLEEIDFKYKLIKVNLPNRNTEEADKRRDVDRLVDVLMGKKADKRFEYIQNNDSVKFSSDERLRIAFENTTTNAGIRLDNTIFNSLESLGLIYKIEDDSLRNGILNLYQKRYVFLKEITDYHLHTIQQMDEVILENFVMSKKTRMWNLDYSNNLTRKNIIDNQVFQNYLAANKSTHSILEFLCKNILNDVNDLIEQLNSKN